MELTISLSEEHNQTVQHQCEIRPPAWLGNMSSHQDRDDQERPDLRQVNKCLRNILRIRWPEVITNADLRERTPNPLSRRKSPKENGVRLATHSKSLQQRDKTGTGMEATREGESGETMKKTCWGRSQGCRNLVGWTEEDCPPKVVSGGVQQLWPYAPLGIKRIKWSKSQFCRGYIQGGPKVGNT